MTDDLIPAGTPLWFTHQAVSKGKIRTTTLTDDHDRRHSNRISGHDLAGGAGIPRRGVWWLGDHVFLTEASAVADANHRVAQRIESLEGQLERLRTYGFSFTTDEAATS